MTTEKATYTEKIIKK
ncbi:hypothetical protein [Bergeyella cardium]